MSTDGHITGRRRSSSGLAALAVIAYLTTLPLATRANDSQSALGVRLIASGAEGRLESAKPLDEEAEAAAWRLVQEHLPALAKVLDRLKSDAPAQYDKAVREIARSAKRLDSMRRRDEQLYQLELDLLKARTTVSLLVARLKVRDSAADRKSLKAAVTQLRSSELARANYEVAMLEKRLQRTQTQLADARARVSEKSNQSTQQMESVYEDYLRKAGRKRDAAASPAKPRPKSP